VKWSHLRDGRIQLLQRPGVDEKFARVLAGHRAPGCRTDMCNGILPALPRLVKRSIGIILGDSLLAPSRRPRRRGNREQGRGRRDRKIIFCVAGLETGHQQPVGVSPTSPSRYGYPTPLALLTSVATDDRDHHAKGRHSATPIDLLRKLVEDGGRHGAEAERQQPFYYQQLRRRHTSNFERKDSPGGVASRAIISVRGW